MPTPRPARIGLAAVLSGVLTATLLAEAPLLWQPATTQDLLQYSDLVVVGTLVDVEHASPGPDAVDTATLEIEQILHGWTSDEEISLVFPGLHRGQYNGAGELVPENNPAHIRFDLDQEGIFFLMQREDGTYSANHPARFKPRFFLPQVLADLGN